MKDTRDYLSCSCLVATLITIMFMRFLFGTFVFRLFFSIGILRTRLPAGVHWYPLGYYYLLRVLWQRPKHPAALLIASLPPLGPLFYLRGPTWLVGH